MGITIGETLTLTNGLSVTNAYGSLHNTTIKIDKSRAMEDNEIPGETFTINSDEITITCRGNIWASKALRDSSAPVVDSIRFSCKTTTSELSSSNLYTIIYNQWKTKYTTVSDAL